MISSISVFLAAALISLLITLPVVRLLIYFKLGQPLRAEAPARHRAKAGTPTMGGIGFIPAILVLWLVLIDFDFHPQYLALLFLFLSYAAIGLADDLLKIIRRQNLGLTFREKILAQTAAAGLFAFALNLNVPLTLWTAFVIVGSANAANLTDGLNGLLAGTASIAFIAFAVLAAGAQMGEAALISLIMGGAVFAFLFFNFPKARVFMGDVGSLAVGAGLAGLAIIMHEELRLAVIGGVFVLEALSVILQVSYYKLFKRRIFKMTPLHHHFELMGIKETSVTIGFWLAGLLFAFLGVLVPWW